MCSLAKQHTLLKVKRCNFAVSCFALDRWDWKTKHYLISCFLSNTSAKNYRNRIVCVKIIASHRWDVFWDTVYILILLPMTRQMFNWFFKMICIMRLSSNSIVKYLVKCLGTFLTKNGQCAVYALPYGNLHANTMKTFFCNVVLQAFNESVLLYECRGLYVITSSRVLYDGYAKLYSIHCRPLRGPIWNTEVTPRAIGLKRATLFLRFLYQWK